MQPFLKKGRNVTVNNYFTSVKLTKQHKSQGTVETVKKKRDTNRDKITNLPQEHLLGDGISTRWMILPT